MPEERTRIRRLADGELFWLERGASLPEGYESVQRTPFLPFLGETAVGAARKTAVAAPGLVMATLGGPLGAGRLAGNVIGPLARIGTQAAVSGASGALEAWLAGKSPSRVIEDMKSGAFWQAVGEAAFHRYGPVGYASRLANYARSLKSQRAQDEFARARHAHLTETDKRLATEARNIRAELVHQQQQSQQRAGQAVLRQNQALGERMLGTIQQEGKALVPPWRDAEEGVAGVRSMLRGTHRDKLGKYFDQAMGEARQRVQGQYVKLDPDTITALSVPEEAIRQIAIPGTRDVYPVVEASELIRAATGKWGKAQKAYRTAWESLEAIGAQGAEARSVYRNASGIIDYLAKTGAVATKTGQVDTGRLVAGTGGPASDALRRRNMLGLWERLNEMAKGVSVPPPLPPKLPPVGAPVPRPQPPAAPTPESQGFKTLPNPFHGHPWYALTAAEAPAIALGMHAPPALSLSLPAAGLGLALSNIPRIPYGGPIPPGYLPGPGAIATGTAPSLLRTLGGGGEGK